MVHQTACACTNLPVHAGEKIAEYVPGTGTTQMATLAHEERAGSASDARMRGRDEALVQTSRSENHCPIRLSVGRLDTVGHFAARSPGWMTAHPYPDQGMKLTGLCNTKAAGTKKKRSCVAAHGAEPVFGRRSTLGSMVIDCVISKEMNPSTAD